MSDRNKKRLYIVAFIVVAIILLLFLKKNPQIIKQVESAIAPGPVATYDIPLIGDYIPRDYAVPPVNSVVSLNNGCNFCSRVTSRVVPPAMPISQPSPIITPAVFNPSPFGGGAPVAVNRGAILTLYG